MIPSTEQLIQLIQSDQQIDSTIIESYCLVTSKYGDKEDAAALFHLFKENPSDYYRSLLLDPVMRCGDMALAEEIDYFCLEHKCLKEDMPSTVLHMLGYMGYEKHIEYMADCMTANDWHLSKDACLGLLHLPCEKVQEKWEKEFEKHYGQALFLEFLPALSFKFANEQIVPRLHEWGSLASTDCNAGLILGISMFGRAQKDRIKSILMDPHWEMYAIGTGSHWWGYMSMQMVELTFCELISDLKDLTPLGVNTEWNKAEERAMEDRFDVLHDLLQLKLVDERQPIKFIPFNQEKISDLYQALFQWSNGNEDDSVIGRIRNNFGNSPSLLEKYYELRIKMELAMKHEIELKHLESLGKYRPK